MNKKRAVLLAMLMGVTVTGGTAAWADRGGWGHGRHFDRPSRHHHHHRGGHGANLLLPGLVLGSALVWAATRPEVVVKEPAHTVVIPEPVVAPPPPANQWWYYCRSSGAYYPYVGACASGWERVPARP